MSAAKQDMSSFQTRGARRTDAGRTRTRVRCRGGLGRAVVCCLAMWVMLAGVGCGGDSYADVPVNELREDAARELGYFNFEDARDMYQSILGRPDFAERPARLQAEVHYGLGVAYHHISPITAGNTAAAEEHFRAAIEALPESDLAARATLNLARIAELSDYSGDEVDLERARELYRRVRDQWSETDYAGEAAFRLGASYVATLEPEGIERGMAMLERRAREFPDDPLASAIWQYMGDTYFDPLEDYENALRAYVKADEIGLLAEGTGGGFYWKVARIADQHVGDTDVAIRYYQKIITDAPNSGFAYEAQLALEEFRKQFPDRQIAIPEIQIYKALEEQTESAPGGPGASESDPTVPTDPSAPDLPSQPDPSSQEGES